MQWLPRGAKIMKAKKKGGGVLKQYARGNIVSKIIYFENM